MKAVKEFKKGDRVKVVSGPEEGLEGFVLGLNSHGCIGVEFKKEVSVHACGGFSGVKPGRPNYCQWQTPSDLIHLVISNTKPKPKSELPHIIRLKAPTLPSKHDFDVRDIHTCPETKRPVVCDRDCKSCLWAHENESIVKVRG